MNEYFPEIFFPSFVSISLSGRKEAKRRRRKEQNQSFILVREKWKKL